MTVREQIEISENGILCKYACTSVDEVGTKRDSYARTAPNSSATATAYSTVNPSDA